MATLYLVCAVIGGGILVLQTILMIVGGVHADFDSDGGHHGGHDGSDDVFFKVLSFKTLVAFLAFFGVAGMWGNSIGVGAGRTLLLSVGAGSLAVFVVGWLMSGLARLQAQGNVDLAAAVGRAGHVYLRVPPHDSGVGKVVVELQGRRVECKAFTRGAEIPTGAQARIVGIVGEDVLEIECLDDSQQARTRTEAAS